MALWGGRFSKETDALMKEFSSSIDVDARLWQVDLKASATHARMLGRQKILSEEDTRQILSGLEEIAAEIASKTWTFDPQAEDIHGEIERRLFEKIGDAAKRLHTARSRNDQVATDTRLYLKEHIESMIEDLRGLQQALLESAQAHEESYLPGLTHFQHAQPVSLAHHLLAYFWMFERDVQRLKESLPRVLSLPLGAAALAGTGFPIDRAFCAEELGFLDVAPNSLDAVSDRDFVIEFLSHASIAMMHLSRFCEEMIIWSSPEFGFVELDDAVTTGSSIMPQKKNPDSAELIRGRTGRVYGALIGALTMMKALPLAYNRDMQEDKVHLFSGIDTLSACLRLTGLMIKTLRWRPENMIKALKGDFSNATDLADHLAEKGLSFREAHEIVGGIVKQCLVQSRALENISLEELKKFSPLFDESAIEGLPHSAVARARASEGGTAPQAVRKQIQTAWDILKPARS